MALNLLTSIPATCYTSQLQKISLSTSDGSVILTITHQAANYYSGNGQTRVFQAAYSTRNNSATIYDIGSLLETFMLEKDGLQQFIFRFNAFRGLYSAAFSLSTAIFSICISFLRYPKSRSMRSSFGLLLPIGVSQLSLTIWYICSHKTFACFRNEIPIDTYGLAIGI